MKRLLSPFALGFVLLAEGWASLGTEILALRRLTPWAGSSVDVTSVLLAIYLAALAGGYRRGGRLARLGDPRPRLAHRLAAASLWSAFWLSEPGVLLAFSLPAAPLLQTFIYAVVGIAPVGWLLAECVLLAHACAAPLDASERAGGVFALSTVGNVTGALAATFLLMPTLGLAAAVFSVVAASAAAALLVSPRNVSVHVLILAACWPSIDLWVEATRYVSRNAYADYRIVAIDDDARVLVINNQSASRHDPEGQGWDYAELLERTLCGADEHRVLVLGAAGMTIGQGAPCELDITFVDIDPEQDKIAARFLGVPKWDQPVTSSARTPAPTCATIPVDGRRSSSMPSPIPAPCPVTCSPPSSTASRVRSSRTAALSTSITPPTRMRSSSSPAPSEPCAAFSPRAPFEPLNFPPRSAGTRKHPSTAIFSSAAARALLTATA